MCLAYSLFSSSAAWTYSKANRGSTCSKIYLKQKLGSIGDIETSSDLFKINEDVLSRKRKYETKIVTSLLAGRR
jgi:hypothetical protein